MADISTFKNIADGISDTKNDTKSGADKKEKESFFDWINRLTGQKSSSVDTIESRFSAFDRLKLEHDENELPELLAEHSSKSELAKIVIDLATENKGLSLGNETLKHENGVLTARNEVLEGRYDNIMGENDSLRKDMQAGNSPYTSAMQSIYDKIEAASLPDKDGKFPDPKDTLNAIGAYVGNILNKNKESDKTLDAMTDKVSELASAVAEDGIKALDPISRRQMPSAFSGAAANIANKAAEIASGIARGLPKGASEIMAKESVAKAAANDYEAGD